MPRLQSLDVEFVSLVDRAAVRDPSNQSEPQRFLLWKRESGANDDSEGGIMSEDMSAALEKAETERDDLAAQVEKLEKAAAEVAEKLEELEKAAAEKPAEPVEIDKNELSPAVREALEKAEARAAAADERIEKAEKLAKAEQDLRIEREFVAKAELLPHVAQGAGEFGKVLKAAAESLSKEDYAALEQRLDAANEQIGRSDLFKQFGNDGDGERSNADDIARKADEIRKSDSGLSEFEVMRRAARGEAGAAYLASVR